MTALQRALREAVGATRVEQQGDLYRVAPGMPSEVGAVLAIAAGRKIPVHLADSGATRGIVVDITRMHNVLHLDEVSATVHAQGGITLGELARVLAARGVALPDHPDALAGQTLSACLADPHPDTSALRSASIGLSAVLPDGRVVHVKTAPRRATGPDFRQLFLGAEGAFGLLLAATLRLEHSFEADETLAFELRSFDEAWPRARTLLGRGLAARAIRLQLEPQRAFLQTRLRGPRVLVDAMRELVQEVVKDAAPAPALPPSSRPERPIELLATLSLIEPVYRAAENTRGRFTATIDFPADGEARLELDAIDDALVTILVAAGARTIGHPPPGTVLAALDRMLCSRLDPRGILGPA